MKWVVLYQAMFEEISVKVAIHILLVSSSVFAKFNDVYFDTFVVFDLAFLMLKLLSFTLIIEVVRL